MKKVIVLGSLNMDLTIQCVDLPKNGETINGSDFFVNPGGKGGNQAVAAAKLGAETHMSGRYRPVVPASAAFPRRRFP